MTVVRGAHGDVHVLEDQSLRDASTAVGRFNQVVASLATMFPPECIDEGERLGELASLD